MHILTSLLSVLSIFMTRALHVRQYCPLRCGGPRVLYAARSAHTFWYMARSDMHAASSAHTFEYMAQLYTQLG